MLTRLTVCAVFYLGMGLASGQSTEPAVRIEIKASLLEQRGVSKHVGYFVGGFYPNYLEVRLGQQVTIELNAVGGTHSLVIPELGLKTGPVSSGERTELIFVADRLGEFEILCGTVCGNLHRRMVGRLVVTEPEEP